MSSYKLVRSFWANVKGSFSFASLCVSLQEHHCCVGYSKLDLCLTKDELKFRVFKCLHVVADDCLSLPGPELQQEAAEE